jgi:hypothetical protein
MYGGGGFDDDFGPFPDEFHGVQYCSFAYGDDLLHLVLDNGECEVTQGFQETIANGLGVDGWDDVTGYHGGDQS